MCLLFRQCNRGRQKSQKTKNAGFMRVSGFFPFSCTVCFSDSAIFPVNSIKQKAVWKPDSALSGNQTALCFRTFTENFRLSDFQTVQRNRKNPGNRMKPGLFTFWGKAAGAVTLSGNQTHTIIIAIPGGQKGGRGHPHPPPGQHTIKGNQGPPPHPQKRQTEKGRRRPFPWKKGTRK